MKYEPVKQVCMPFVRTILLLCCHVVRKFSYASDVGVLYTASTSLCSSVKCSFTTTTQFILLQNKVTIMNIKNNKNSCKTYFWAVDDEHQLKQQ